MSTTFRKKIKLSKSYGIKDSIDYVSSAEKSVRIVETNPMNEDVDFETLDDLIDYASNEDKTRNQVKQYCFCRNCEISSARQEMEDLLKKYDQYNEGETVLYHTVVSFAYTDPISNDELVEYGQKLLDTYYKDFMSVGYCHINPVKGTNSGCQPHFHIITAACDMDGNRLRDGFYGKTGLMTLREVCDKLSLEYNCEVITMCNNTLFHNGKRPIYMRDFYKSHTQQLQEAIDNIKPIASTYNELLELLELEYSAEINNRDNDDVSVALPGYERFKRLQSLGGGYSKKDLIKYFAQKQKNYITETDLRLLRHMEKKEDLLEDNTLYVGQLLDIYNTTKPRMTKYEYKQFRIAEDINKVIDEYNFINQMGIQSKSQFQEMMFKADRELRLARAEYKKQKEELADILETKNLVKNYLQLFRDNRDYEQGKIPKTDNVETFLAIKKVLEEEYHFDTDLNSIRSIYREMDNKILAAQELLQEVSKKQNIYRQLSKYKPKVEENLDKQYKSITFTEKNVVSQIDDKITFKLPYLNGLLLEVPINCVRNKYNRYSYYVIDDEPLNLTSETGETITDITGAEVWEEIEKQKTKINNKIAEDNAVEVSGSMWKIPLTMIDFDNSDEKNYLVRIPYKKQFLCIPGEYITVGKTYATVDTNIQTSIKRIDEETGDENVSFNAVQVIDEYGYEQKPRYIKYIRDDVLKQYEKLQLQKNKIVEDPVIDKNKDKENNKTKG